MDYIPSDKGHSCASCSCHGLPSTGPAIPGSVILEASQRDRELPKIAERGFSMLCYECDSRSEELE